MNPKALVGIGIAAAAGIGFLVLAEGDAKAEPGKKELPGGGTKDDLALATTIALTTQNIPDVRSAVAAWNAAKDPLTSGAISFTLDGAVAGQNLAQWTPDGEKGSPLLRAFGLRVLQLEGRPDLLRIWSKAWKTILPLLSEELRKKAEGIKPSVGGGTTDDPIPPKDLVDRIEKAVASGNTELMRKLADELERLGFKDAANDLRAAAKAIEDSKVEPPAPPPPDPVPDDGGDDDVTPPKPKPAEPARPKPAAGGGAGRIYVVLSGDNPSKIAKKLTGNGNRFSELVRENVPPKKKGKDGGFTTLFAGERLRVPASWPAHPEAIFPGESPPAPRPSPSSPSSPDVPVTIVQSGDGFIRITKRLGQPESRWRELRDANVPRDARGKARAKDTDAKGGIKPQLNPGDELFVPTSWAVAPPAAPGGLVLPAGRRGEEATVVGGPRFYVVKAGESASKIAATLTGNGGRWKELVAANSPPKTKAPDGNFKFLAPGEKLKIPASWPAHPAMVFSGDDVSLSPAGMAQIRAGRIGLDAHHHKVHPGMLAEFQTDHGLEATGEYGIGTAICLCIKYGMVPPVPHVWGTREKANRQKFADAMFQMAKRDPQRRDEFRRAGFEALGKAAA